MNTTSQGARTPKGAEPARPERHADGTPTTGGLLFVSAGLSPHGGGIAAAGRLMLDATRAWADERKVRLRLLTLGGAEEIPTGVDGEAFEGDRLRLARAVWRAQRAEGFAHHVYDFLGVARIQGVLPRRLRARYLVYLHGIECWRSLRLDRRAAVEGAARVLANSRYTADRMSSRNAWHRATEIVPLAIGEPSDSGNLDQLLLDEVGAEFILIVGRLAPGERYKGHESLLEAIAVLARKDCRANLVIAGEGEDRARLETRARELGVSDRVHFTGFVSAVTLRALYERCALFAMPSNGEGFGFVYLEAMRASKPCIALAGTAPAEIIVEGETGKLVEEGVEPLARALEALLGDPTRARRMGEAGRARWQQQFRPARFAADFHRELEALVTTSSAPAVTTHATAAATRTQTAVSVGHSPR